MLQPARSYNSNTYTYGFNGKIKDDEVTGITGSHLDFGDRMYDSRIGRWFTPDKLSAVYAPVSPYNFSLNNPILFKDADGNVVVGLDGQPVTYEKTENGQIKWSSNASADVQKLGNAMIKTSTGEEAFIAMQNSSTNVNININYDGEMMGRASLFDPGKNHKKNKNGEYKEVSITVSLPDIKAGTPEENRFKNPDGSLNEEEALNAVGVVESGHLAPAQILKDEDENISFVKQYQNLMYKEIKSRIEFRRKSGDKVDDSFYDNYKDKGFRSEPEQRWEKNKGV